MSEYPNLHKLLICRSLLDDTAIQSLMAVLDGDKRQTGPCAAKIIETAEDVGLHGNLLRSYIIYLLVHDPNLAAQTIEMHDSPVGTSLKQAFLHDLTLLLPFLTEPASLYLDLTLLDAYKPTVPLHTEASTALERPHCRKFRRGPAALLPELRLRRHRLLQSLPLGCEAPAPHRHPPLRGHADGRHHRLRAPERAAD